MKNIKWISMGILGTALVFQLGSCGIWGTVGAALVGWALLSGVTSNA